MFIIEFVGAPGVGKTTLSNKLSSEKNFIHQDFIIFFICFKSERVAFYLQNISSKSSALEKIIQKIGTNLEFFHVGKSKYLLSKTSNTHLSLYFSYFSSLPSRKSSETNSTKRLRYFLKSANLQNFAAEVESPVVALIDEGYAQRGISLSQANAPSNILEAYFKTSPLPNLLVHIDLDINTLKDRIERRNGKESNFLKNAKTAIETSNLCKKIYLDRGCECLTIDNTDNIHQNIKHIIKYLNFH